MIPVDIGFAFFIVNEPFQVIVGHVCVNTDPVFFRLQIVNTVLQYIIINSDVIERIQNADNTPHLLR